MMSSTPKITEADKRAYQKLPSSVHTPESVASSDSYKRAAKDPENWVKDYISKLLPSTREGQSNFQKKIEKKVVMLENPITIKSMERRESEDRGRKKRKRRSKKMNARERRKMKIFDIPKSACTWENFVPLRDMWMMYMNDLMPNAEKRKKAMQQVEYQVLKADLHGAFVTVIKAKNPSLVGIQGIIVMESLEVFKLVTKDDRCITVAKMNTVFTLQVHGCTVTLFGNNLRVRSFHRTVGKFKAVRTVEL